MIKLIPCRYCGHSVLTTDQERDEWYVTCGTCHARGPICSTFDKAREAWNGSASNKIFEDGNDTIAAEIAKIPIDEFKKNCEQIKKMCPKPKEIKWKYLPIRKRHKQHGT